MAVSPTFTLCSRKLTAKIHRLHRRTHFPWFKPATKNTRWVSRQLNDADFPGKLQMPKEKPAARIGRGHIVALQHLECRALYARRFLRGGSKHVLMTSSNTPRNAKRWKADATSA